MSRALLASLAWQDTCVEGLSHWAEVETPSGDWLRIKKKRLGGYLVTRFGADKMLKTPEVEMDEAKAEAELLA